LQAEVLFRIGNVLYGKFPIMPITCSSLYGHSHNSAISKVTNSDTE